MTALARFVLYEHRSRPATAGEVEAYLAVLLGRACWGQRVAIPSRLSITTELGGKDCVMACYCDDLADFSLENPENDGPDEYVIRRGGFPLLLADWLLAICDPMRTLHDPLLEASFPSVSLFLLYHRLRNLASFVKTLDQNNATVKELTVIAERLYVATAGIPTYIPFARLAEAVRSLGYIDMGKQIEDPVVYACLNAGPYGPNCIWKQPPISFLPQGPAESLHRMSAWLVVRETIPGWDVRCPW